MVPRHFAPEVAYDERQTKGVDAMRCFRGGAMKWPVPDDVARSSVVTRRRQNSCPFFLRRRGRAVACICSKISDRITFNTLELRIH
jgi:hypothetical protein